MTKDLKDSAIYTAYDDFEPKDPAAPEKNLLLAILLTAIRDLEKAGSTGQHARDYFMDSDDSYVFSFVSVCTLLGVDPERVLTHLGLDSVFNGNGNGVHYLQELKSRQGEKVAFPPLRKRPRSPGVIPPATSHHKLSNVK